MVSVNGPDAFEPASHRLWWRDRWSCSSRMPFRTAYARVADPLSHPFIVSDLHRPLLTRLPAHRQNI